jgi:hypothetical protein
MLRYMSETIIQRYLGICWNNVSKIRSHRPPSHLFSDITLTARQSTAQHTTALVFLGSSVSFFISQFLGCVVAVQWPRYVLPPAAHLGVPRSSDAAPSAAHLGVPRSSRVRICLIVFQSSGCLSLFRCSLMEAYLA